MNKAVDIGSSLLARAGDILFIQNPRGTSLGAFGGVAVDGLLKFFSPSLARWKEYIAPDRINTFYLMALGIACFNIPNLFRRRRLPDPVENAIEMLRLARKEGRLSTVQYKMSWLALCNSVIEQVNLDPAKLNQARGRTRPTKP